MIRLASLCDPEKSGTGHTVLWQDIGVWELVAGKKEGIKNLTDGKKKEKAGRFGSPGGIKVVSFLILDFEYSEFGISGYFRILTSNFEC
jgi:hypothetical protein